MRNVSEEIATLLIVEDDVDVADMLKAYFLVQGYDVLVANWGEDAVRLSSEQKIDLALLDIRLPDMDGFEVANRLRAQANNPEIPIIFLTEHRERQFRMRGLELEAQDYITKPFDIEELKLRIRNTLRHHRRRTATHRDTYLPEGIQVDERLAQWLQEPAYALLLTRIIHLDSFQSLFGITAATDFLRIVGNVLVDSVQKLRVNGFIGHFSDTDFILLVPENCFSVTQKHIQRRLRKVFQYLDCSSPAGAAPVVKNGSNMRFSLVRIPHSADVESLTDLKEKIQCSES